MSELDNMDAEDTRDEEEEGAAPAAPLVTNLGPGVYDIDMQSYIADPCVTPSLRSGDIQRMLRYTPAHVRAFHPRLVTTDEERRWAIRKATRRMDSGSVIHALVLGKGSKFCVIDKTQFMTKTGKAAKGDTAEYKAAKAEAQARGLIVLDPATSTACERAAQRLRDKLNEEFADLGGWPFGEVEQTLIWTEETAHGPVMCRARTDFLSLATAYVGEVKSSASGLDQRGIDTTLQANDGHYIVQAALQRRGVVALHPELAGRVTHTHAWIETSPPYLPRIAPVSTVKMEMADRRITRAVEAFALCTARGEWRDWPPTIGASGETWLDREWLADEEQEAMK